LIPCYAATKLAVRKKGNQLLEDGVPVVHAPSSTNPAHGSKSPARFKSRQEKMPPKLWTCNRLQLRSPSLTGQQ
jgi:hypothetical protein